MIGLPSRIELDVRGGAVELVEYSRDATLDDLRDAVEAAREHPSLVTNHCAGCGRCCRHEHLPLFGFDLVEMRERRGTTDLGRWVTFPPPPSPNEREDAVGELMRDHSIDRLSATLLYEYNVAEPISYGKRSGGCVFLEQGFCGNYSGRAYTCSLYACTMGDRLMALEERIVRQGVWHSYFVEGWVSADAISHNPFLSGDGYGSVLISAFDVDLPDALESLFFYF